MRERSDQVPIIANDALEDDVVLCLSAVVVSVLDPRGAHSFLAKKGNFCSDAST